MSELVADAMGEEAKSAQQKNEAASRKGDGFIFVGRDGIDAPLRLRPLAFERKPRHSEEEQETARRFRDGIPAGTRVSTSRRQRLRRFIHARAKGYIVRLGNPVII